MLYGEKSREQLNDYAEKLFKKVARREEKRNLYDDVCNKFGISIVTVEEMITFKRDIKEFTTFEVFCVVWFLDRKSLSKFFTEEEINLLQNEKVEEYKFQFPIIISGMIQIASDQWIGKITVQQLMEFKKARLINYEEGEQRALRRMKSGSIEIYRPYVSNKNVREIRESMENGTYVPDPITLNMPEGSEFNYNDYTLTIYSLPKGMFNLDDGYHRYLAMAQIYDFDHSFDYPMELRVVNFSNAKANNFIFQQDQKTPMKKIVSDSYNVNSVSNKIVQRLNEDPSCNIQGMIGRNGSKIDSSVLAKLIEYFFVNKKIKREDEISHIINIKNKLRNCFNIITETDEAFLSYYSNPMLFVIIYIFASDVSADKYVTLIKSLYENLTTEDMGIIDVSKTGTVRKKGVNRLAELMEAMNNV